jgi:hypothetical protein
VKDLPDLQTHKKISELLIGNACEQTNRTIDYPVRFLGREHRILFHDPLSAALIGMMTGGRDGVYSALIHLAVDKYCGNQIMRKFLEYCDYFSFIFIRS